jgi:hypothetical protein
MGPAVAPFEQMFFSWFVLSGSNRLVLNSLSQFIDGSFDGALS